MVSFVAHLKYGTLHIKMDTGIAVTSRKWSKGGFIVFIVHVAANHCVKDPKMGQFLVY